MDFSPPPLEIEPEPHSEDTAACDNDEWMYALQKRQGAAGTGAAARTTSDEEVGAASTAPEVTFLGSLGGDNGDAVDADGGTAPTADDVRKQESTSQLFGSVDGDLLGVLYRVGLVRKWSPRTLGDVLRKLVVIGATTSEDLMIMVHCGALQQRLRLHGFKTFSKETLRLMLAFIGLGKRVAGALASHAGVQPRAFMDASPGADATGNVSVYLAEKFYGQAEDADVNASGLTTVEQSAIDVVREDLESAVEARDNDVDNNTPSGLVPSASVAHLSMLRNSDSSWTIAESIDAYTHARFTDWDTFCGRDELYRGFNYAHDEWRVVEVPLEWLYFYQTTVAGAFRGSWGAQALQGTIDQLREGSVTPQSLPLMQVVAIDGILYAMGSRRLLCYMHVWGRTDPQRRIPVLFNGRATSGLAPNRDGMNISVIGQACLDGRLYQEISRPRRLWTSELLPSFQCLLRMYDQGYPAVVRDGEYYVDIARNLTPQLM